MAQAAQLAGDLHGDDHWEVAGNRHFFQLDKYMWIKTAQKLAGLIGYIRKQKNKPKKQKEKGAVLLP